MLLPLACWQADLALPKLAPDVSWTIGQPGIDPTLIGSCLGRCGLLKKFQGDHS
jgi:hypothetical protein